MVVGLTSSQYLVQEDGKGGRLLPGHIIRYPKVYKEFSHFECHKILLFCRMPIMTYPKGSLTTSSDSQSLRDSSRITTLCLALLTLSWCMSLSRCLGIWLWTSRQLRSSRGMPGVLWRPQWRSLPSGSRILRLFKEIFCKFSSSFVMNSCFWKNLREGLTWYSHLLLHPMLNILE